MTNNNDEVSMSLKELRLVDSSSGFKYEAVCQLKVKLGLPRPAELADGLVGDFTVEGIRYSHGNQTYHASIEDIASRAKDSIKKMLVCAIEHLDRESLLR